MRFIVVGGFLGSGKTTTVIELGKHYASLGNMVGIIVNEIGEVGVDGDIISQYGLQTKEITSGCICCSMKTSLRASILLMIQGMAPDILIIESTGLAYPGAIRDEILLMNLPVEFEMAPLLTLFDGSRFKKILKEIRNFASNQLAEAEVIAVSKSDLVEPAMLPIISEAVRQMNPLAKIVTLSSQNPRSIEQIIHILDGESQSEPIFSKSIRKDGSILMAGGKSPDSVADSGVGTFSTEYHFENHSVFSKSNDYFEKIVREIMAHIRKEVLEKSPDFLGHIKLFLEVKDILFKISLTSSDEEPTYHLIQSEGEKAKVPTLKVLSAVTGVHSDDLKEIIQTSVEDVLNSKKLPFIHPK